MFRRHGVVAMEVVKLWGYLTSHSTIYTVSPWVGTLIKSKPAISSGEKKRKFPTGNGWHIAPPYKLLQSVYDSQEGGFEGSYPSTSGLLAQACRCEMVAIPPRMLFSTIRYISGSVMRSSLTFVYFKADAQASDGRVIKWTGVETMLLVN